MLVEAEVEAAALQWLDGLGYRVLSGASVSPDRVSPERVSYGETLLLGRLRDAIRRLNGKLPSEALEEAVRKIRQIEKPSLVEENRRLHRYLTEGLQVEVVCEDGSVSGEIVRLVDFVDTDANDWLVVNQFTVIEGQNNRRADLVVFINGIPLAVVELKGPGAGNATLHAAFNQLQTYKDEIPSLFRANAALVISDGLQARLGSLNARQERFMPWRTVEGTVVEPAGTPELRTLIEGAFEKSRFLSLLRDFTVFSDTGSGLAKIVAGYHQFHAVRHAVARTIAASSQDGDRRIGVIWHTQGSGKSLLMAFYAGQIINHPSMENPTVVAITDRNDLDDQLFGTFGMCRDLLRQTPQHAESREHLRRLLARPSGGVIFATIQKFAPDRNETDHPLLTDRRNVVVIADEAHRTQYGFRAKVERRTGEISYGFAKYLRDALPNASFIGFTGTPIEREDASTPAVFGEYIDVYDINRGVEDGLTVPIYYESRLARVDLDQDERKTVDDEVADLTEEEAAGEQERLKRRWANVEAVVGAEKRLAVVAKDLVSHFESRIVAMDGKAMIVCMSRRICVALYDQIVALRPEWHNDDDGSGALKVVMTGNASDPTAWQPHIGGNARRELLAKRAKDADDPLKLVIVRDMWLTGFDAPSMHTMYVDKPMRGHGLMQAIARVNRVFHAKPAGLVVDYIGVAQNLKSALAQYSRADRRLAGVDVAEAVAVMLEKYEIVDGMFHGFDYQAGITGSPKDRLAVLAGAIEWILDLQRSNALRESTEEGKKLAHRRVQRCRSGAIQSVCAGGGERRSACDSRQGRVFPNATGRSGQEYAWIATVIRRAGSGRAADRQQSRRFHRDRRHP